MNNYPESKKTLNSFSLDLTMLLIIPFEDYINDLQKSFKWAELGRPDVPSAGGRSHQLAGCASRPLKTDLHMRIHGSTAIELFYINGVNSTHLKSLTILAYFSMFF